MKLYHYDETSGVLLWSDNARLDELESQLRGAPVFVVPALATTIAPPSEVPENHIAYFDFEATPQEWKTVEIVPPEPETEPEPIEPEMPVIPTISKRQFWQQIAMIGWIGRPDALAFMATGILPEAFETALETLDDDMQFAARMALMANEYDRNNSFVPFIGQMFEKTDEQIDALFIGAANN